MCSGLQTRIGWKTDVQNGIAVDLSQTAKGLGFSVPVIVSSTVWYECIEQPLCSSRNGTYQINRILQAMRKVMFGRAPIAWQDFHFDVILNAQDDSSKKVSLVAVCETGNADGPVIGIHLVQDYP